MIRMLSELSGVPLAKDPLVEKLNDPGRTWAVTAAARKSSHNSAYDNMRKTGGDIVGEGLGERGDQDRGLGNLMNE